MTIDVRKFRETGSTKSAHDINLICGFKALFLSHIANETRPVFAQSWRVAVRECRG